MTSRSPRCFFASTSRTVIRGAAPPPPLLIGAPGVTRQGLIKLRDLSLPERAIGDTGMRHDELRAVHTAVAEAYDIQVDRARPPPALTHPARRALDLLQPVEERGWLECRLDGNHLIEVRRLGEATERFRFFDLRCTQHSALRGGGDGFPRAIEIRASIAEVRSERDVGDLGHDAERRNARAECQFNVGSSPMRRTSVGRVPADTCDATRQVAQARGDLTQLVRRALEL